MTPFVYGLVDPLEPKHVRYVGMAMIPQRPWHHLKFSRWDKAKPTHKVNWIRKLLAEGREYSVIVLEQLSEGSPRAFVGFVESCYIKSLRAIGHKLTNATDGGDGWSGKRSAEHCARQSARQLGKRASDEHRRALSLAHLGNRSAVGSFRSPEWRLQHSRDLTGRVQSSEERLMRSAAQRRPETVAKKQAATLGSKHSEATKEKMRTSQKARRERERS